MTGQEVFNTVVNHLRKQGHKAETVVSYDDPLRKGVPQCVYLDPVTGDRCAAGCLIDSREYNQIYEGKSIISILDQPIYEAPQAMVERLQPHAALITALQHIHDRFDTDEWENQLRDVAERYELQYTPLAPSV